MGSRGSGLVADNASNNNTMLDCLEYELEGFEGSLTRLSQFVHKKKKPSPAVPDNDSDEDNGELDNLLEPMDNNDIEAFLDVDEDREAADDAVISELEATVATKITLSHADILGEFAVTKLTQLAKKVFHNDVIHLDLEACCGQVKPPIVPARTMIHSIPTCWNTVAEVIEHALSLQPAIDHLTLLPKHNHPWMACLKRFSLSDKEWELLRQLWPLLDHFLQATKRMSASKIPQAPEIIPIIDLLMATLDKYTSDRTVFPAGHSAATKGCKIINKYYLLTDESIVYQITMILHPRYKTLYFQWQKWPDSWIDTAIMLLHEHWEKNYKPTKEEKLTISEVQATETSYFTDFDSFSVLEGTDELDKYLALPAHPSVSDP
ncbi:hypothetical protein K439DRAFT_1619657 [Ramaria rubella]|nr:hypothetical protein K439DRAFT_1619657 [Ramaria rubella]